MFKAPLRETCATCQQVVYPTEKMVLEGMVIHKNCFICKHCSRKLTVSNFAAVNGQIYCKVHYLALFKEHGGRYDKAFGAFQSGRNLKEGAEAAAAEGLNKSSMSELGKSELNMSETDLNMSASNRSVLETSAVEVLDTSRLSSASALNMSSVESTVEPVGASSVKARKEALERKTSSTSVQADKRPEPATMMAKAESPVKALANAIERKASETSLVDSKAKVGEEVAATSASESAPEKKSVKSMKDALDKIGIVSRLGQSMPKPASTSGEATSTPVSSSLSEAVALPGMQAIAKTAAGDEDLNTSLTHATIARPIIPAQKRRRPTVDKGLFQGAEKSDLGDMSDSSPVQMKKKAVLSEGLDFDDVDDDDEVDVTADTFAAFYPSAEALALRSALSSCHGLFDRLEEKKRALKVLLKQKQAIIKTLQEHKNSSTQEEQPTVVSQTNPNEGDAEEEEGTTAEVTVEDEDAFLALKYEEEGDPTKAKEHHLRAFRKALDQPSLTDSAARAVAAFAAFMVRSDLRALSEDDELVQSVSDAFDSLFKSSSAPILAIANSVEAERAVFLYKVLEDYDDALEAFQKAYTLFPDDPELLGNYAFFLGVLAKEEEDQEHAAELLKNSAELYREAIELAPGIASLVVNLVALLVRKASKETNPEERQKLLLEAKERLVSFLDNAAEHSVEGSMVYNLACVECQLGNLDSCQSRLKQAVALDRGLASAMQSDPDLDVVRGEGWFRELSAAQ